MPVKFHQKHKYSSQKLLNNSFHAFHVWENKTMHFSLSIALIVILAGCATVSKFQMGEGGASFDSVRQRRTTDCGLASLIAVMDYWNVNIPLQKAKTEIGPAPREGYSLNELKQYAETKGLVAFIMPGTIETLSYHTSLGRPCIVVYKKGDGSNHGVVVLQVDDSNKESIILKIMDPVIGRVISVSDIWLIKRWEPLGYPILLVAKGES
jgi:ABC-type bacteriocin/lantibiotic exporter with double-glycine peptidase domain